MVKPERPEATTSKPESVHFPRRPPSTRQASTSRLNAGISSSKEIPAATVSQNAASAKAAAMSRRIMRYLTNIDNPGGSGLLNADGRTVSKR